MPALAALTVNDGASTPVAHTFNPVSTNGAKADWADRSPGAPAGFLRISHEVRNPGTPTAAYRMILGFNVPVSATVNGVVQVIRNSSAQVTLNFAPDATEQERKDLLAYVANTLGLATMKTSAQNIEPFW
jgi:hypothetical protein